MTAKRYQGGGQRRSQPPEKKLTELWPNYLQGGYFDAEGNLRPEYVARKRVEPLVREMADARPKPLTMHQLRRFFQHCRAIEARLKGETSMWAAEKAAFLKLDYVAAGSIRQNQAESRIPRLFYDFIRYNVACVESEKDFLEGFLPHFEALVGFGGQYLREKDRN